MIPGTGHGSLDHVGVLLARLRLQWLLHHFSPRLVWSAYVCVNCFVTIGLLACWLFSQAARLSFRRPVELRISSFFPHWQKPRARAMPSRAMLLGSFAAMQRSRLQCPLLRLSARTRGPWSDNSGRRSVARGHGRVDGSFRVSHPPAGATTLIVSLGIISQPKDLAIIEAAVVLLTAQALAINRLAGLPYPLWREGTPPGTSS